MLDDISYHLWSLTLEGRKAGGITRSLIFLFLFFIFKARVRVSPALGLICIVPVGIQPPTVFEGQSATF